MRSLRVQLILSIVLVLGIGLGVMGAFLGSQVVETVRQAFTNRQQYVTLAIATSLSGPLMDPGGSRITSDEFKQNVNAIAAQLGVVVTVFSGNRIVLASSDANMDAQPALDLRQIPAGIVRSEQRANLLYTVTPVLHDGRIPVGFVQVAGSLDSVNAEITRRWLLLLGSTAGVLLLAGAVGWWLAGRIARPLVALRNAAGEMARGNLHERVNIARGSREVVTLGAAFNDMAERIQSTIQRQREFVANASHELRAPLAAIKIRAESLVDGSATGERAAQYAREMNDETTQLAGLVTDLLALSRTDARNFTPPADVLDIADELSQYSRVLQPRIHAKGQQFSTKIDPAIPPLRIAPGDLRLMVGNLLDNAVKYTPEGGAVALNATWCRDALEIEVRDTGEGIPPADLPRVTERFFRVDRSRHTAGTGLGLALVVATAQQYGGSLELNSSGIPGEGTRAVLRLPAKN